MDLVEGVSNYLTLDIGLLTYLTGTTHPAFRTHRVRGLGARDRLEHEPE